MASGEEEEGGHDYEEEEDIFPGGMDPTESLNVLSVRRALEKRSFYQGRSGQSSVDKDEGDDSTDDEFGRRQESVKFDVHEDEEEAEPIYSDDPGEDSLRDYEYGISGTTPPKSFLSREKRKNKQRAGSGKNLSQEARLAHQRNMESRKHSSSGSSTGGSSHESHKGVASNEPNVEQGHPLSKKEKKKLARALSPPQVQVPEDAKFNKKHQKIQRIKDRDEKKGFLQPKMNSSIPDISRSLSEGSSAVSLSREQISTRATDYTDSRTATPGHHFNYDLDSAFPGGGIAVTESLNPYLYRRGSGGVSSSAASDSSRARVRRTNSDAQFFPNVGVVPSERRCPHERKQFYRQFIKNLKYYGIRSVTGRLEPPGNSTVSRFQSHSVNFGSTIPLDPKTEKIWLGIRSKLKNCAPYKDYEEWLFFYQNEVERILRKILNFCFTGLGAEDSMVQASTHTKGIHSSISSPQLLRSSKTGAHGSEAKGRTGQVMSGLARIHRQASMDGCNDGCGPGDDQVDFCEALPNSAECESAKLEESPSVSSSLGGVVPEEHNPCKVSHHEHLSLVQQKALSIVTELLKELDEVESLYINRKKMGGLHHVYVTKFFKRRVCALILWQKVTHGLADNLCRLSNWLGAEILLPDVCKDPPLHPTPSTSYPASPSSSAKTIIFQVPNPAAGIPHTQPISTNSSLHQIHEEEVIYSGTGQVPPSPLSSSFRAQFSVGSPVEGEGEEGHLARSLHSASETTEQAMSITSGPFDSSILQRRMAHHQVSVLEPYREFVSGALKRTGLSKTTKRLKEFMKSVLTIAKYAMGSPSEEDQQYLNEEDCGDQKPLQKFMNPELIKRLNEQTHEIPSNLLDRSTSIDAMDWMQEFKSMELPPFTMQYIQLVHVPLDVMQECLQLQSELGNELRDPSSHSVKQLADECREILEHAIDVREFYRENMRMVLRSQPEKVEQVEADIEAFEVDMKRVLKVYFQYLKKWVTLSSGHILEEEWRKVKTICTSIRGGEAEAGRKFCDMVTQLLSYMGDDLETKMDDCCSSINLSHTSFETDLEPKDQLMKSCREFKELFVDVRERVNRVLGFAKILRKDLEIAADFEISTSLTEFFSVLKSSDHVRVVISHQRLDKMIFVPESFAESKSDIQQLLKVSFAHGCSQEPSYPMKDSYILLMKVDMMASQSSWTGKTIEITASAETTINLLELQVDSLKMVVSNSSQLTDCRNSFMRAVNRSVTLCNERTSSHENVAERIHDLKMAACELAKRLMETASKVMEYLKIDDITTAAEHISSYRNTMHSCFNLGFEYVREVFRLLGDDMAYRELGEPALEYTITWIRQFVLSKCERGRGTRPRWASLGLEFMVVACAPTTLASISQNKFESVRKLMNRCMDHVVGEAPATTSVLEPVPARTRKQQQGWFSKPIKLLPAYALGHSFTGLTQFENEDDDDDSGSLFKLPNFGRKPPKPPGRRPLNPKVSPWDFSNSSEDASLLVAEPPDISTYNPGRTAVAAHIVGTVESYDHERQLARVPEGDGVRGGDMADGSGEGWKCNTPSRSHVTFQRQRSSASPPTSTESLPEQGGSSSGVDSSPAPSQSDITYTPPSHGALRTASFSSSPITPSCATPVNRSDSVLSSASSTASRYYSQFSAQFSTQSSSSSGGTSTPTALCSENGNPTTPNGATVDRIDIIRQKIQRKEEELQWKLIESKQVGKVKDKTSSSDKGAKLKKLRQTNFKWQLGRKLGQGSFGKVYECLNRTTGEINAVKQVSLQDKDSKDIETIIEEIENFQKVRSEYIVKFYGAEVHHNELYMFMEYCNEGTLWTIAQQGLTEQMIRHYTRDILKAVDSMHTCNMVHRDIKGANIFLSSNGSIKLGDFGLSVQLQNFKNTNAKEIVKQAGTIPYLSPEIILKGKMGKPMDIWAVGCVVIEMATGKLPWSEFKESFAIMYKLGSGERPSIARAALSDEGHRFLDKCLMFDVDKRPTAIDLVNDPFVKVSD